RPLPGRPEVREPAVALGSSPLVPAGGLRRAAGPRRRHERQHQNEQGRPTGQPRIPAAVAEELDPHGVLLLPAAGGLFGTGSPIPCRQSLEKAVGRVGVWRVPTEWAGTHGVGGGCPTTPTRPHAHTPTRPAAPKEVSRRGAA